MEDDLTRLWKSVLAEIEPQVSRANFLTLFKHTVLLSLENDTATIAAPSPMITNLLEKRYVQLVKHCLDQKRRESITIAFVPKTLRVQKNKQPQDTPLFSPYAHPTNATIGIGHLPRVRPDYTFETMAVSSSNQLAFVSAKTVVGNLGRAYNPLFVYGPVGVGKTHLMQAVANAVYAQKPDKKIIYITSEEFTNEVVEAIKTNDTAKMKQRFRNASLLLIDDIQFIAGKERVQEELFHTFNILIDNGAQIVLSSDRPPQEIKKLEKRLSSRFTGGLTVDIEPPDLELKAAIIAIKAQKYNVALSSDLAMKLAEKAQDGRSLEGVLLRVITEARTRDQELSETLIERVLKGVGEALPTRLHPDEIIKTVCEYYDIKSTLLKGPKRDASLVKARQVTMYLLKKQLSLTLVEIGNLLGGRDHTTVMHGISKVEKLLISKEKLSEEIVGISKNFSG